jgi:membrane protein DedA with SNARE-associated domain
LFSVEALLKHNSGGLKILETLIASLTAWLLEQGYFGLGIIMFLAGSIAPIPWELVLLPAGASGLDPFMVSLSTGVGATVGGAVGYFIGFFLGRTIVIKYGKYFLLSSSTLHNAEQWINRWGAPTTLILRSIQYLPYKTYNIAAGISRMNFPLYIVLTLFGTVFRCFYMVYFGSITRLSTNDLIFLMLIFFLASILLPISRQYYKKDEKS